MHQLENPIVAPARVLLPLRICWRRDVWKLHCIGELFAKCVDLMLKLGYDGYQLLDIGTLVGVESLGDVLSDNLRHLICDSPKSYLR